MDVVKSNIEKIGGIIDVSSRLGGGTAVKIKIPLTLAIIPGLVISSGDERFVIPQVNLLELIRLDGGSSEKQIEQVQGTSVYRRRGSLLPVVYLNQVLGLSSAQRPDMLSMVVLQAEDRQFGLVVDGISDTQEIVVKPLSKQLKGMSLYAGATIMGDGRVALILDVLGIGQSAGVLAESREQARAAAEQTSQSDSDQQRLLLFQAGSFHRLAVPLSLVARLEEIPQGAIERAGGAHVVQYRGRILPLVQLASVLDPACSHQPYDGDSVQVIVFNDGDRSLGLVVDKILDVVDGAVSVRQKTSRKGLLGSSVIGKRVTDFLDLNEIIHAAPAFDAATTACAAGTRVLLADASAFTRGVIRPGLEMAGYRIVEAASLDEALRSIEQQPPHIILAALDLPRESGVDLAAALRNNLEAAHIPILALADAADPDQTSCARKAGFADCHARFDREAILASLGRFTSPAPHAQLDGSELALAAVEG